MPADPKPAARLTVPEACAVAGVSESTLRRALASGALAGERERQGRRTVLYVQREDLDAWRGGESRVAGAGAYALRRTDCQSGATMTEAEVRAIVRAELAPVLAALDALRAAVGAGEPQAAPATPSPAKSPQRTATSRRTRQARPEATPATEPRHDGRTAAEWAAGLDVPDLAPGDAGERLAALEALGQVPEALDVARGLARLWDRGRLGKLAPEDRDRARRLLVLLGQTERGAKLVDRALRSLKLLPHPITGDLAVELLAELAPAVARARLEAVQNGREPYSARAAREALDRLDGREGGTR